MFKKLAVFLIVTVLLFPATLISGNEILTEEKVPSKIKVLISEKSTGGIYHEIFVMTSTEDFLVTTENNITEYKAGENFELDKSNDFEKIYIKTKTDNGKINITSIKRNGENPFYRGELEISKNENGIIIVNNINIEEYLYSVVSSEMPSANLETAKVQAIAARSYAYNQLENNKYIDFSANVDDTVNSQVYNNVKENNVSIQAVKETEGLCIIFHDKIISANYFSTSAGVTANNGEVWASGKVFPTKTSDYLSSVSQVENYNTEFLSQEEEAEKFFKNKDVESFEKNSPWFRWNFEMTNEELTKTINNNLESRYLARPDFIKTLNKDTGVFESKFVSNIGDLVDLEVVERGTAGNIMELKIIGTEETVLIYTEYNIRYLIRPIKYSVNDTDVVIFRNDDSVIKNYSVLPSAFFTMDKSFTENANLTKINFFGGGNGHGVGMSQNGVIGMSENGFNHEEIIKHFYKGTEIKLKSPLSIVE